MKVAYKKEDEMVAKKIQHRRVLATDNRPFLISMVAKTMHLTKGEADLLLKLSEQQDGFSPSAKFLMDKTSLSRRGVFKARNYLAEKGIIGENDRAIIIDWSRIRLLATLDPHKTSRKAWAAPVASSSAISTAWKKKIPRGYASPLDFFIYSPDHDAPQTIQNFFSKLSSAEVEDVLAYLKESL